MVLLRWLTVWWMLWRWRRLLIFARLFCFRDASQPSLDLLARHPESLLLLLVEKGMAHHVMDKVERWQRKLTSTPIAEKHAWIATFTTTSFLEYGEKHSSTSITMPSIDGLYVWGLFETIRLHSWSVVNWGQFFLVLPRCQSRLNWGSRKGTTLSFQYNDNLRV